MLQLVDRRLLLKRLLLLKWRLLLLERCLLVLLLEGGLLLPERLLLLNEGLVLLLIRLLLVLGREPLLLLWVSRGDLLRRRHLVLGRRVPLVARGLMWVWWGSIPVRHRGHSRHGVELRRLGWRGLLLLGWSLFFGRFLLQNFKKGLELVLEYFLKLGDLWLGLGLRLQEWLELLRRQRLLDLLRLRGLLELLRLLLGSSCYWLQGGRRLLPGSSRRLYSLLRWRSWRGWLLNLSWLLRRFSHWLRRRIL